LPQFPMLLQVDLNGHLAALVIGHVLDSGHGFIFFQVTVSVYPYFAALGNFQD